MQLFSRNKAIVALSLGALALGACGDDVTVPVAPLAPVVISITPPSALMNVGESVNFAVQISGGSTSSVPTLASCSSSAATVATATVAGSSCRVTAIAAGNATITAAASTGQVTAASVAVAAPAPAITALAVSPSAAQLAVGSSLTVVPTVNRANASVTVVYTYTSSTAAVATVSAAGMVTAVAPGTTTITVSAAGTGTGFAAATLTSAATITVSDRAPGLTSLQVSPATASLTVGGTQSVTASAQGPRAAAATMTYNTSAPAIATVSATGVITAVAAGTATITVTAQSTQDGAFAASSLTGLVTVTVSNLAVVSINISALTQGPTTTSYASANGVSGIVSAANAQVGQPIDINNTRDQIQMTATLATNGARVDSVVAYVANADGTNRTSVGSQSYPSGGSSGALSLYINTADFTADFTAGTAAVKFANGPKLISVSAFSGATELQSTNSQTVSFNNVDGYASRATAPATSATNSAGQVWFGGPDSLTTRLGSATIVPVFYTAGRTLNNITVSMRQGAGGETLACSEFLVFQTGPYKFVYGGAKAVAGDTTVVNCSTLESAADHVVGVSAATDNNGTPAPTTSYAGGFRTSTTVAAPVARKLDYVAPTLTAIVNKPALPADTSKTWLNGSHSFAAKTAISTDAGVGASPITGRVWQYLGCGVGSLLTTPVTYVTFDGTTSAIAECISSILATVYTVRYTDTDLVGNSASATATFGIDKTAPLIAFAGAADSSVTAGAFSAVTYTPSVFDAKSGIDSLGVRGFVARYSEAQHSTASGGRNNQRGCYALALPTIAHTTAGNIAASTTLSCTAETFKASLGTAVNGYQPLAAISTQTNESMVASVTVFDRAGNTATSTRRAMHDNVGPVFTVGLNSALTASATPSINGTYADRRIASAKLSLTYNSVVYRYPATVLGTAFGSTYTPTTGPIGTSSVTATPAAFTMTTPMAAPFALGVGTGASAFAPLSQITINGLDAAGNASASVTDAVNAGSVPVPTALTSLTSSGTFAMLTSLSAAGGAAAGAKVQLTGAATTTANPYSRVDFYRETSGNYDYLGSSVTVATSTSTTGNPIYTWTIDSYTPINPNGTATIAAAVGDQIVAMGVRSNGGADLSAAAFINGASVRFTVAGLAVGSTTSVTVTGPNAFTQTVSTGNATLTIGVPEAGVYTVTPAASITAAGIAYTASHGAQSVTVVGSSVFTVTNTYTYTAQLIQASVQVAGLPAGVPTTLTFTQAGQATVTYTAVTGANIVNLGAVGTWTIAGSTTVTTSNLAYTTTAGTTVAAAVGTSAAAAAAPITYANTTFYVTVTTSVPALSGVVPNITVTPTSGTFTASITTVGIANRSFGTTAPGSTVFLANPVVVAGITYGVGTSSVTRTPTISTSSPETATFTYGVAKTTVVFSGTHLTDLTGYTVPVILVGPAGEQVVNAAAAVSATATAAQSLVIAGSYSVKAIPSITIGSSVYSFATSVVAATYGSTSALVVTVTRTNTGNAINGVMTTNASAGTTADWDNGTINTTRAVTYGSLIGLTGPAATVTYSCTSSDAAIVAVATLASGVATCTLTGATSVMATTAVTITFTATGGGTSLTANAIDSTIAINRIP